MILLVAEHAHGTPRRSASELVTFGRDLAAATGRPLAALVVGADAAADAAEAMADLVEDVIVVRDPRLDPPRAETLTRAVAHVAAEVEATIVLVPGSRAASSYGPRVAVRLGGAYVEGATALKAEGDDLIVTRPTYLARFDTTVAARAPVTVVGVSPGAVSAAAAAGARGTVRTLVVPFEAGDERLHVDVVEARGLRRVSLEEADVVVCGGRGLGSGPDFDRHVGALAERLDAAVGVTRAVVDAGWRTFEDLVGQTGKAVAPKLCLVLGVSGAAHFVSGVSRARVLVAVNTDADAPIFRAADYGIVGDVRQVVPALLDALAEGS